jgi:predicted transcriptional regulator
VTKTPSPEREPTRRELEILKVLWDQGRCSVREVHRVLAGRDPDLAYNTVQTLLKIMEEKDLVVHVEEGRAFIYTARCTRDDTAGRFLDRVFDGMASSLVSSLLASERIGPEELDRILALIASARQRSSREEGGP